MNTALLIAACLAATPSAGTADSTSTSFALDGPQFALEMASGLVTWQGHSATLMEKRLHVYVPVGLGLGGSGSMQYSFGGTADIGWLGFGGALLGGYDVLTSRTDALRVEGGAFAQWSMEGLVAGPEVGAHWIHVFGVDSSIPFSMRLGARASLALEGYPGTPVLVRAVVGFGL